MTESEIEALLADAITRGDCEETERLFAAHPQMIERRWHGGPAWWRLACESRSSIIGDTLLKLGVVKLDDHIDEIIRTGDVENLKKIFTEYPEMLHRGSRDGGDSWLSTAAQNHRLDMARVLLDLGVDIHQGSYFAPDENALFAALVAKDFEMVEFLLEHGANAKQYKTVISAIGSKKRALDMVKLLEKHGADLHEVFMNELSNEPMNALSTALDWGKEVVAEYLRSRGCVLPSPAGAPEDAVLAEVVPDIEDEVLDYFRQHFGPVQKLSLIEIVPSGISVAVHFIPPSAERRHITLFTTGLASHPMPTPEGMEQYSRAELFIQLPADWKYQDYSDPNFGWPHYWLRSMAQHPGQHDTWLGGAVTVVDNEGPPRPLVPNTRFNSLLLMAERDFVSHEGHTVQLYRMTPLYPEERDLERREGIPPLLRAFDRKSIPFIVDLHRPNVAT